MKRVRRPTPASVEALLCECGSRLPKLSTDRCRNCAAKAAAATRREQGGVARHVETDGQGQVLLFGRR